MGLQSLGQGIRGQVNQQCLAAASANIPRRPALVQ